MRRGKHAPLPEPLRYLQPFVNALTKLHPDEINEDVDPTPLEDLLRKRINGLKLKAARAAIKADCEQLETWLRELGDRMHPAYWVLGFLSAPAVVDGLRTPREPEPAWPVITFDAPPGWKLTAAQNGLLMRKGKLNGVITVIDELTFQAMQRQMQFVPPLLPEGCEFQSQAVDFGPNTGSKYQLDQPFKNVDYLLRIPGGFVSIKLTGMGREFDETEIETQLHTLQVSGAKEYFDAISPWNR